MSDDLSAQEMVNAQLHGEDGFITNEGDFVDRAEAFEIAKNAGQLAKHKLAEPEANKDFYGTSRPSLDSGIVENYGALSASGKRKLRESRLA